MSLVDTDITEATGDAANTVIDLASDSTTLVTSGAAFALTASTAADGIIEITTTLDDDVALGATSTGNDLLQALSSDATEADHKKSSRTLTYAQKYRAPLIL